MSLIQVSNLHKVYNTGRERVHALGGISFEISQGEFIAIIGPSGSGKSTLLALLGGLSHPAEGKVIVDEIDVYSLPVERLADFRREYLGFVFQSFQLIPYLTIIENVMLPLAVSSLSRGEKRGMAREIIEKVGLRSKELRLPDELSGGEQQRVAIARALVNGPPIVLADEPTGNLDSATSEEIMELLGSLTARGHTIVIVTHNPENLKYVRRCIRLRDGTVRKSDLTRPTNVAASSVAERSSDYVC
ncbi:MAG: transporter related protein [Bacteroidetes bacterium]|nr:transporter related protein [Bacteroidota bacterium]